MSATAFTEETIREVFLRLDTSGDGFLSYSELFDGLSGCGLDWNASYDTREMLDRLWKRADRDGNGQVSFMEFWELIAATRSPTEEELARAYGHFKAIDVSGDGVLDRLEVQEALDNPDIDWDALGVDRSISDKQIYDMLDEDGDQRVTFDEFWMFILNATAQREETKRRAAAVMASVSKFSHWTAAEVGEWLRNVGYGQYAPRLRGQRHPRRRAEHADVRRASEATRAAVRPLQGGRARDSRAQGAGGGRTGNAGGPARQGAPGGGGARRRASDVLLARGGSGPQARGRAVVAVSGTRTRSRRRKRGSTRCTRSPRLSWEACCERRLLLRGEHDYWFLYSRGSIFVHLSSSARRLLSRHCARRESRRRRVEPARMEAVTQTARAARRYLGVLLSGDDAARKQLVFSPGRVSRRADVGAGEPARDRSEASGSRARASAPRSGAFAARAPAEGDDAPRVTSRFAAEAATMAGERERPSSREGAKPSDLAEDGDARVVARRRERRLGKNHTSVRLDGSLPRMRPDPSEPPGRSWRWAARSASAASARRRRKRENARTKRRRVFARDDARRSAGRRSRRRPAATRRRLDLLRSLGVVKSNGGVPSTYNVSAAFAKETSFDEAAFAASSPSPNELALTTTSGRVKLVVRGSKGRIGAFRSPGATPRLRGRLRAAATDPKIVRAELRSASRRDRRWRRGGKARRRKRARTPAPSSRPPRFRSGPPTPRLRASRSAPGRCVARRAGRGGKRTTTPCWARRCATSTAGKRVRARRGSEGCAAETGGPSGFGGVHVRGARR